ncbi:AraC family transcriptional regulator [Filimonas effusa]|uniref:AraC family transcriptional regulator n=1 Tax=Filimonas effusa TaxID=2508721 RepID=A0A4Q1D9Y4_9BACT|nr:AraC family transcriptional regulator [Filimonas effusa]RXK85279.1 AraC family transcriptional regulator [Filimonas effusa]
MENLSKKDVIAQYDFFRTKYGDELLIDLIWLEDLDKYIKTSPLQRLSYYDITIIIDGCGTLSINGCKQQLKQGYIFFSSPGQIREWDTAVAPKGYALIFEDEFLHTFFNDAQFTRQLSYFQPGAVSPVLELVSEDLLKLTTLLKDIKAEIPVSGNADKHMLRALLYQALIFLNRKFVETFPLCMKRLNNRYIERFTQLADVHFIEERSVAYYARELHITSGYLNNLVKECYAVSVKKYILDRTITEAKRLLLYTHMGIDEIAAHLHYENTTYFVRSFRAHTQLTPLAFRERKLP